MAKLWSKCNLQFVALSERRPALTLGTRTPFRCRSVAEEGIAVAHDVAHSIKAFWA
ncbi:hypothetical protein JOH51_003856 [Rhizobium leguminosarum]|nr:hypothetical protein [Rhizobium leguminosarum]